MIARDSPLKSKFTGSGAAAGNFTSLALTENYGIQADKTIFNARQRKRETSYGRKPGAPTSGYRAYVAKGFRYFASSAVFCFTGPAPDSSGARNRDIGVARRYASGTGLIRRVDSSGNKGPFRLD